MTIIEAHCGCGYRSLDLEAAKRHADEQNHILHVQGQIEPKNGKNKRVRRLDIERLVREES